MVLAEALECLGLDPADALAGRLYDDLAGSDGAAPAPRDWRILAAALARSLMPQDSAGAGRSHPWPAWDDVGRPLVLGISGGQGAGKTTLARQLGLALEGAGARSATCSLDDFYLSRSRRLALAESVHPLLATRGVPGTHDVASLRRTITALGRPGTVRLPVFDKAADDLLPAERWRPVSAPVDVLVLEGWCLGAPPQTDPELGDPVNDLEAREDAAGTWRRYVNDALAGPYALLWRCVHVLVYLRVPSLTAVTRWRTEQEQALPAGRRMSSGALQRFVAHYERITRVMQAEMPQRAHLLVRLDDAHGVADLHLNTASPPRS